MDTRHCIRCGKSENEREFRNEHALKCIICDEITEDEKREYHRKYHAARHRAVQRLIEKHPRQFAMFMEEEKAEQEKVTANN